MRVDSPPSHCLVFSSTHTCNTQKNLRIQSRVNQGGNFFAAHPYQCKNHWCQNPLCWNLCSRKQSPKFKNSSLQNQDWLLCKSFEIIIVYQWYLNCQFGSWPECVISFLDCPSPIQSLPPNPAKNQKRNCKWYTWLESFPLPKTRIHKCLMNFWLTTGLGEKKNSQILNQAYLLIIGSSIGSLRERTNEFYTCNKEKKPKQQQHDAQEHLFISFFPWVQ